MKRDIKQKIDEVFSRCIRMDAGWCISCKKSVPLDCSHLHGRARLGLRWLPLNCVGQCRECHRYYTDNPEEFRAWRRHHLGPKVDDFLIRLAGMTFKFSKAEQGDILDHYRRVEFDIAQGGIGVPAAPIIQEKIDAVRGAGMQ